jgi:hypothetical protein
VSWSARFVDPIILPDGRKLKTLRDVATHTSPGCRKRSTMPPNGKPAMETQLLVAERDGPEMMARIGMKQALNRHSAKASPSSGLKRAKGLPGHSVIKAALR